MLFQQIATTVAAAAEHEELAPLIAPPFVIGITMFVILLVMLFITLSYGNLGKRHEAVEEHADPHRQHPNKHDHGLGH
ncbi:hypothetical protein ACTWLI_12760 [Arthrobacter sp. Hor0625]|uniref:hypothetical protein n=1 Tax=Arthrobacter sp. Hor0625 TaxID=3457358 RepID=UPI00403EAD62